MNSLKTQAVTRLQFKNRISEQVSSCVEWQRAHRSQPLLAHYPLRLPDGLEARVVAGEPLSEAVRLQHSPELHGWPEVAVHSFRYPVLACIMEGEADFRIGVTQSMARGAGVADDEAFLAYVVQATAGSLILIPPGVPYSDGIHLPHWERPDIADARSCILWAYFVNQGVVLYYCWTIGASHGHSSSIFVPNPWLLSLTENLIDNARKAGGLGKEEERVLLLALLLAIERGCRQNTARTWNRPIQEANYEGVQEILPQSEIVGRSINFIKANLAESLTVEQIAAHAFVSPAQLNRLFRASMDSSVIEFVTRERMELAKTLLERTDITISEVSRSSGYSRANYFSRMFFKATGQTPRDYRESARSRELDEKA
jgi:AraC-like DNA-binding protein